MVSDMLVTVKPREVPRAKLAEIRARQARQPHHDPERNRHVGKHLEQVGVVKGQHHALAAP
jgi:hypothetical protein